MSLVFQLISSVRRTEKIVDFTANVAKKMLVRASVRVVMYLFVPRFKSDYFPLVRKNFQVTIHRAETYVRLCFSRKLVNGVGCGVSFIPDERTENNFPLSGKSCFFPCASLLVMITVIITIKYVSVKRILKKTKKFF